MTATPVPVASGLEQRTQEAHRLLRIDPTTALRTLDGVNFAPDDSVHKGAYQDALALRIVANSMLGLPEQAKQSARDLGADGPSAQSLTTVARWLLTFSGDSSMLVAPLAGDGCGRSGCDHTAVVELALQAIGAWDDPRRRRETADRFATLRADLAAFKLAQAKILRDAGRIDEAVAFLTSLDSPAMRQMAGVLLYDAERYIDARPLLMSSPELHEAADFGARLAGGIATNSPLPTNFAEWPVLRALYLEASADWAGAGAAWTEAERPLEAWESALLSGAPGEPAEGAHPRWAWRYYALTGEQRPDTEPDGEDQERYAVIGRTSQLITGVRVGARLQLTESEDDPFALEGLLNLVVKVNSEPVVAASRLLALEPPERPRDLLPMLAEMPQRADWLTSGNRRRVWHDWVDTHPAPQIPVPKVAQYAILAKTLQGDTEPGAQQLQALLQGLPVTDTVTAAGIALAKGWELGDDPTISLVAPDTIAACLGSRGADLLPVMALLAGAPGVPEGLQRIAGEIGGALVALAEGRDEISTEGAVKAAAVIEESLSEVVPVGEVLSPTSAYEHEREWLGGKRLRAGPILASRSGLDATSAQALKRSRLELYGPYGRARILSAAGKLEAALAVAESVTGDAAEGEEVAREIKTQLAMQQARVGDLDRAIDLAIECAPDAEEAADQIAREIGERTEAAERDTATKQLERLHDAYPDAPGVSVALARLLNQSAVAKQRAEQDFHTYVKDLERAARLDPDSIQIRSNLAQTYFGRGADRWERYPEQAMADLRRAISADPNNGELRGAGSRLALMCASVYAKRKNRTRAVECLEYAVQLDPNDEDAFRALMVMR